MKPIRVLHVLGALNRGGVETWLSHVVRHMDRGSIQTDFLVHTDQTAVFDDEVVMNGSRILRCPHTQNPLKYAKEFLQLVRKNGPFDVLHSHVHHFSGLVLALGRIAGIPVRIAHSHSDTMAVESKARLVRQIYVATMTHLILAHCTHGLAVSEPGARALFGSEWRHDGRLRVLYCGIDLAPFRASRNRNALRTDLGFSSDDVIFGHVGRFSLVKNHSFLLEIATCILNRQPGAKFLFVGDGPLRPEIEKQARLLGLSGSITFAGLRSDIPALMSVAMDAFLLPSTHEGVPLVLMETQAAGLMSVVSDVVTEEAVLNPALVHRLSLSAGPDEWARLAIEILKAPPLSRRESGQILNGSRFDIVTSVQKLCEIYMEQRSR